MRVRFIGRLPFAAGASLGGWKALALAAIAGFEIVLASAALPFIFTESGRVEAAGSFHHVWHICSVRLDALTSTAR